MRSGPPSIGRRLARWLAPHDRRAEVDGDLIEAWTLRRAAGRRDLRRAFWRDVWSLARNRVADRHVPDPSSQRAPARGVLHMLHDIRYAMRLMRRQPAFAALAIAMLAIGIAASTAVFTVCDRVLIRPLPYPDPDRVVLLDQVPFSFRSNRMSVHPDVLALPELAAVGLYASGGINIGDDQSAERIHAAAATSGFFGALAVRPILGRTFAREEDLAAAPVAVLSFTAWQRLFQGDRQVINREIRLNSHAFTVVGVMPPGFTFPDAADVWVPPYSDRQITGAAFGPMQIARLAPGVSMAQAVAALVRLDEARTRVIENGGPVRDRGTSEESRAAVTPLQRDLTLQLRPTLLFISGLVALLLAVTSANIAGLVTSRLRMRERELLVRAALGANRSRLIRQVATECVVLAGAGTFVGGPIAIWAVSLFRATMPAFAPDVDLTSLDVRFFAVGVGVALVTTLVFGLGPALSSVRVRTGERLRHVALPSRQTKWLSNTLVISQVAISLMLLVAGGAALTALLRLTRVDLGFHNVRAIVFELTLPRSRYAQPANVVEFWNRLEAELPSIPGLAHAGVTTMALGSRQMGIGLGLRYTGANPRGQAPSAMLMAASPDYFRAMGIGTVSGRSFTGDDRPGAPPVVILSRAAALALQPDGAGVIGRHLQFSSILAPDVEIVGVVDDARVRGVSTEAPRQMYQPFAQSVVGGALGLVVDAAGGEATTVAATRAALRKVDPELPLYNITRVQDVRTRFLTTERVTLALSGTFAAIGLVLSAIGLYGLLSQTVAQRRREIGIRMALGASRDRLRWEVVRVGLGLTLAGIAIGAIAAFGAARAASAAVPGLGPIALSPATMAIVAALLLITATTAAWVPARRASGVDPVQVLKE